MNNLYIKLLCLSTFFTGAYAMQPNPTDDIESIEEMAHQLSEMAKHCSQSCSLVQDITSVCTRTCEDKLLKRSDRYLIRKYTAHCQNIPFNETFIFTPTLDAEIKEANQTIKAYQAREASEELNKCITAKLNEYGKRTRLLCDESITEMNNIRKEHSVITTIIDIMNKVRRQDNPQETDRANNSTAIQVKIPVKK